MSMPLSGTDIAPIPDNAINTVRDIFRNVTLWARNGMFNNKFLSMMEIGVVDSRSSYGSSN